ncbi:hypothetical protein [Ilumatobacter sp.]|uniref:hypothetical protein n=1 Tax=Ilumatobacter sp. TaxID=1967498 RepID=UPI003C576779
MTTSNALQAYLTSWLQRHRKQPRSMPTLSETAVLAASCERDDGAATTCPCMMMGFLALRR